MDIYKQEEIKKPIIEISKVYFSSTCWSCNGPMPSFHRKCRGCGVYKKGNTNQKDQRNKRLVEMAQKDIYTLEEIGFSFGISRERVRQIYKKETGNRYKKHIEMMLEKKRIIREQKKEERENEIVFCCAGCQSPIKRKNRNSGARRLCETCRIWCTKTCRDISRWIICGKCNNPFHPFRSGMNGRHFCSKKCYMESRLYMGEHNL